ncbi:alpha/beta hydrolase family protein [Cesiribacter andamanensis]|uniref:Alpha/beta hydrolase family protein n=1 Tax=Cesiribacter andamanensis AMV16 TaxID=1279009 RepID=M7MXX8_9BACT|nr:alpha/beta hydrolase family protein [Cesiribacter andamanensis]EMR01283.1 Alpha/beta hydrolase family protein [Cesiribacter andamanensis AMV16]
MFRLFLVLAGFFALTTGYAQPKKAQDFGFRHLNLAFEQDPVNVLILSRPGEEQKKKPLFLYIQDELPIPLIIYDEQGAFGTFPFHTEELLQHYHLAIIGKPFIPVVAKVEALQDDFTYHDPTTAAFPQEYQERNQAAYYLARNLAVLAQLRTKTWISTNQLVVAGHGEGSLLALQLAAAAPEVTHLIYSGGVPSEGGAVAGGIAKAWPDSVLRLERLTNSKADSLDSEQANLSVQRSLPAETPAELLLGLHKPVLVVWGSEAENAPSFSALQKQADAHGTPTVRFLVFEGLTHHYFGNTPEGEIDYDSYHWDQVADAWLEWLRPASVK